MASKFSLKLAFFQTATTMDSDSAQSALVFLSYALTIAEDAFFKIPGSAVVARYVRSSHQNDPGRTILELILFFFAIFTLLRPRERADKNFIKYKEDVSLLFLMKTTSYPTVIL